MGAHTRWWNSGDRHHRLRTGRAGRHSFVELPQQGATVAAAESMGEVESTKSVSDIFTPVSGTVVAINELLDETPELINSDPYGQGWICKIQLSDDNKLEQLLSSQQYAGFLGTQ